jgi:hypothetical protein
VPIESLGFDSDADVVPIESLAPDEIVQIESLAPDSALPEEIPGLELTYKSYGRLLQERGSIKPSLEALLRRTTASAAPEEPAVPIDALCYRGQAALERAGVVREELAAELNRRPSLEALQPLLQELLDLVPLALAKA